MVDLSTRRIALIGGAGFVGHHLALELRALGAEVYVIDSLAVNNFYSLRQQRDSCPHASRGLAIIQQRLDLLEQAGVPLKELDARDYSALSRALTEVDADTVVHLAAVSHAGRSNKDPFSTFDHSLRTLENALDNARSDKLRIRHFIYLSSSMVYGPFRGRTVTEQTPCEPLGIYGALKYAGEKLVIAYHQVFDLCYTIVRPSALYGPRCISRRVGQVFIEQALQQQPLPVHGDGSSRLDFTYIDDLLDGMVAVLNENRARNQILNMTYGHSRSITEFVELLRQWFPDLEIERRPAQQLMPRRGTLSIEQARKLLGYAPQYPLERGLAEYVAWYRANWELLQGSCGPSAAVQVC